MKRIFVLALIALALSLGCAKHDSSNRTYRKPGNDFIGNKATDDASVMQEAIATDDLNKVKELLEKKADVDMTLPNKKTPLIHATREGKYRIMHVLIKHKAKLDARDGEGLTALDHAVQNAGKDDEGNPLMNRAVLLLSEDAQLTQRKELMKFAGRGSSEPLTRLLKDIGVDPNFIDATGETPLTLAIRKRKPLGVMVLAQWKDCPGGENSSDCLRLTATDLNFAASDGVKPLAAAKQLGILEIVEILTKAGAKE